MRKLFRDVVPLRNKYRNKTRAEDGEATPPVQGVRDSQIQVGANIVEYAAQPNSEDVFPSPRESQTLPLPEQAERIRPVRRYDSAPELPVYDYDRLPETTSLRVLELLPGHGEDPVVCKLHVTDWNDPIPFEAISYAWGDPRIRAWIECDGKKLGVTPNLVDCLHQLRRRNESRFLWADAICINQEDLEERGHQVDNMRRIYECAQRLLIWLGRDDGGYARRVEAAMRNLAQRCCDAKQISIDDLKDIDNLWDTVSCAPYRVAMPMESWQAIERLFLCSWFSRLWVFQEVVSSAKADVHWGDVLISWDIVGLTATYIQSWSHVIEYKYLHSGVYNCYIMRNRNNHIKFSVPSILDWSRTFRCSDPLDRIYAMLGFPSFHRNGFSIQANYKRTPEQLFIEVVNQCIKADKNLQVLSYTDHTQNSHLRKPSWVPQWDPGSPGWTIGYKRTTWTWCATKGMEMKVDINFEAQVLSVAGVLLGVVKERRQISNARWFPYNPTREHPITQIWKDSFHNEWKYPSGERAIDVLGGIFVAGIPSNECNCCTRQEIVRRDFASYVTRCAEEAGEDTNEEVWKELYHKGGRGDWKGYEQNGMNFCFGRSFFTMKEGYMGLGPNTMEADDVVVLLYGGDVPYILRPRTEGGHVLVGEAYVHGVMLGELMPKVSTGEHEEQIWELH
ncbi:uncharacterized protein PV09_01611 [Verruconis gallopava]|uniref:Heterokaryon incompatibility domain-containing protein n=1 Tax=Verruconis gallopava TaxID=253628 RepID=A0A0D1XXZ1_9PEZI|nr:uncharacterized protein PV09_01611 [Verruconis gallopava]KIW07671.1 hypothetical protein PV09_01611 [Verruconis gallopava]